MYIWI